MYISLWYCLFQHCLQELRLTCGWRSVCRIFACLGTTMGIWAVLIEQLEMTWTIWVMLFIKCMSHWSAVCYLLEMKQGVQLTPAKSHVIPFVCLFHHPLVWHRACEAGMLQPPFCKPSATHLPLLPCVHTLALPVFSVWILCCPPGLARITPASHSRSKVCYERCFKENFVFHIWVWGQPSLLRCPPTILSCSHLERSHKEMRSLQVTITWGP